MRLYSRHQAYILSLQLAAVAAFVAIWQFAYSSRLVSSIFVSSPLSAFSAAISLVQTSEFAARIGLTLEIAAVGTVIAAISGMILGLVIGSWKFLHSVLDPYITLTYSMPKVIFIPLLWTILGLGFSYQLSLGTLLGFFPVLVNSIFAVKSIDPSLIKMAKAFGSSKSEVFYKIVIPATTSSVLSSLRICFTLSLFGVLAAQMFVGQVGLGYLAVFFADQFAASKLIALGLVTTAVGFMINGIILLIERRLNKWNTLLNVNIA